MYRILSGSFKNHGDLVINKKKLINASLLQNGELDFASLEKNHIFHLVYSVQLKVRVFIVTDVQLS